MTIVSDILKQMPGVRQPQRKFLIVLFTTILVLRGRVTGRNLSRYCEYSERTIARQFRAAFDWPAFHQQVMSVALAPTAELISVQDTSFIPKSGKQTFGLGYFFNGCANRAERGLEMSTLAVVDVTRRCAFTLAVAQTPPGKAEAKKHNNGEDETRIDFYAQQLHAQRHRLPAGICYHCVDGYFAKQWMGTLPSRSTGMRSSPCICISSPNCATTPTVCFPILALISNAGGGGGNMMAKSTFRTCPALRRSAHWRTPPYPALYHSGLACLA